MNNIQLKTIKNSLKELEYSIYPVLSQFMHQDKQIDNKAVEKIYHLIDDISANLTFLLEKESSGTKYAKYIGQIFINLKKFLKKIFSIARARDTYDHNNKILSVLHSLKEFGFFASAVTLGVCVNVLGFDQGYYLTILGIVGLVIYFLTDILLLKKYLNRKQENDSYRYKNIKRIIESLESLDDKKQLRHIDKLERVIVSSRPEDTLDYKEIIELKHLYFHYIKGKYVDYVRKDAKANKFVKGVFEVINKFVENIAQIIVFSLVAVDSNRPISKEKNIVSRLLGHGGLLKFVGYVMLNAITYNFFYTVLLDDIATVFALSISSLVIFLSIINYFEQTMVNEVTTIKERID